MERQPVVAGRFYPGGARECAHALEALLVAVPTPESITFGGMVPHAGWSYSGPTAAFVYAGLRAGPQPETLVITGAVHHPGVNTASAYPDGTWRSPLGTIEIDAELAAVLVNQAEGMVIASTSAHAQEHAIEVQVPFVQFCLPNTRLLPVAVPPQSDAPEVGTAIARAARQLNRRIAVVASTDLTHYGAPYGLLAAGYGPPALAWTHQNDQRFVSLVREMDAAGLLHEARERHNACGAGAVAAAVACASEMGSTGAKLLHYTTSHEVDPVGEAAVMVGYAAMAFI